MVNMGSILSICVDRTRQAVQTARPNATKAMRKTARRIRRPEESLEDCVPRSCHGMPRVRSDGKRGGPMPPRPVFGQGRRSTTNAEPLDYRLVATFVAGLEIVQQRTA